MSQSQEPPSIQQTAHSGRGSIQQAGHNITTQTTKNILIIPMLIGLTAMGGIAWAIYAGINQQDTPKVEQGSATPAPSTSAP